jgi:hypothetical protein
MIFPFLYSNKKLERGRAIVDNTGVRTYIICQMFSELTALCLLCRNGLTTTWTLERKLLSTRCLRPWIPCSCRDRCDTSDFRATLVFVLKPLKVGSGVDAMVPDVVIVSVWLLVLVPAQF